MINPVIYTFNLFGHAIALRWYGVIVMVAIIVGAWIIERELKRRGEKSDYLWDVLLWVVLVGILGARLWYVVNAILGGNRSYLENPISILATWEGGLHIFGGFLFGAIVLLIFLHRNKLDPWLFLDAAGPAALIGQGIGRIANFINQELYGPPTNLPWGIHIQADHRLPKFPVSEYPVATTRFHPTFAYEMLWNFVMAGILLWIARRYEKRLKPGTIFAGWLLAAGVGRTWIELFFRPDQPLIPGTGITYSAVFAALMAVAGALFLLVRYQVIRLKFTENWEEEYQISEKVATEGEASQRNESVEEEPKTPSAKSSRKMPVRRITTAPRGTRRAARAKKGS